MYIPMALWFDRPLLVAAITHELEQHSHMPIRVEKQPVHCVTALCAIAVVAGIRYQPHLIIA
jgi:hypothetical protein